MAFLMKIPVKIGGLGKRKTEKRDGWMEEERW